MKSFKVSFQGLDALKVALEVGARVGREVPGTVFRRPMTAKPDWVKACDDPDFGLTFAEVLAECVVAKLKDLPDFPKNPAEEQWQIMCDEFNNRVFGCVLKHFPGCEGSWVNEGEEAPVESGFAEVGESEIQVPDVDPPPEAGPEAPIEEPEPK